MHKLLLSLALATAAFGAQAADYVYKTSVAGLSTQPEGGNLCTRWVDITAPPTVTSPQDRMLWDGAAWTWGAAAPGPLGTLTPGGWAEGLRPTGLRTTVEVVATSGGWMNWVTSVDDEWGTPITSELVPNIQSGQTYVLEDTSIDWTLAIYRTSNISLVHAFSGVFPEDASTNLRITKLEMLADTCN